MSGAAPEDCFLCRVMRSFGVTGLGALIGGFGALALGVPRAGALWAALVGGAISAFAYLGRRSRRERE